MSQPITNLLHVPVRTGAATREPHAVPGSGEHILDESTFHRMLCLERKRSERSRRRFALMLLETAPLLDGGEGSEQERMSKVVHTVLASTRDTDLKGWYRAGSLMGVIFTEIGDSDAKAVTGCLLARITAALSSALRLRDSDAVKLDFHVFPETSGDSPAGPADSPLYPDLTPHMDKKRASRALKRAIDITGSAFALLLLSPLFIAIAAAIKLTSKGPILFRQTRVGLYGNPFTFLKFRSMYTGSDESVHKNYVAAFIAGSPNGHHAADGRAVVYKLTNDRRVTSVGKFLRRTSLDELPQLFNVLAGEMSLVGPRPPISYEYEHYDVWHRRRLLTVKPGITGLWQVGGRSRVKFDDMIRMDLKYASTWSVWLDIRILLRTPRAVLSGDGAY